jgi:hypothetical protein
MKVDVEIPPGGQLGSFVVACTFIVSLCRAMLIRIADRSAVGARSFARGPLSLHL